MPCGPGTDRVAPGAHIASVGYAPDGRELDRALYADGLLVVEEKSPLHPGRQVRRYYARGTGLVLEETVAGGSDEAALVGFTPGSDAR